MGEPDDYDPDDYELNGVCTCTDGNACAAFLEEHGEALERAESDGDE